MQWTSQYMARHQNIQPAWVRKNPRVPQENTQNQSSQKTVSACTLCATYIQTTVYLQGLTWRVAPWRMMDSRTLTPAPIVTPVPMETLGPNCTEKRRNYIQCTTATATKINPPGRNQLHCVMSTATHVFYHFHNNSCIFFIINSTWNSLVVCIYGVKCNTIRKDAYHSSGVDVGCRMNIDVTWKNKRKYEKTWLQH